MFGLGDNGQTQNDDPAMLDNVAKLASQLADHVEPQQTSSQPQLTVSVPAQLIPDPVAVSQTTTNGDNDNDDSETSSDVHVAQPAFDFNDNVTATDNTATESPEPAQQSQNYDMPDFSSVSTPVSENSDMDSSNVQEAAVQSDATPLSTQIDDAPSQPEVDKDHLVGMKQQALEHLEPLVGHLDQSPEETFKTTMMMIQANDNHTLIEKALQAAKLIEDNNVRAQAMLDIINEINYFTQS